MQSKSIRIYTDGSCHTQQLVGAWAAIIFSGSEKIILKGTQSRTTHNRMEIVAVLEALNFIRREGILYDTIEVYSDSQYVVELPARRDKLNAKNFMTNAGKLIQNADLVKQFYDEMLNFDLKFIKVKAHQQNGDVFNKEVDILVRELLRKEVIR